MCVSARTNQSKLYKVENCKLTASSLIPISIQPFQNNQEKSWETNQTWDPSLTVHVIIPPCLHFTCLEGPLPPPSPPPSLASCYPEIKKTYVTYPTSHTQHPSQWPIGSHIRDASARKYSLNKKEKVIVSDFGDTYCIYLLDHKWLPPFRIFSFRIPEVGNPEIRPYFGAEAPLQKMAAAWQSSKIYSHNPQAINWIIICYFFARCFRWIHTQISLDFSAFQHLNLMFSAMTSCDVDFWSPKSERKYFCQYVWHWCPISEKSWKLFEIPPFL